MQVLESDLLFLKLPYKVSHNVIHDIEIRNLNVLGLVIDFQKTTYFTLSGIMYLICLAGYLKEVRKRFSDYPFFCEIINMNDKIKNLLMNFGFFSQMVSIGNLFKVNHLDILMNNSLLLDEKRYKHHQIEKSKSKNMEPNLIMPISTIILGDKNNFDSYLLEFRNMFLQYFKKLSELDCFSFKYDSNSTYQKDFTEFYNAVYEIIKNIYNHSGSWGLGAIHADEKNGIQISYYDIGIGIAQSMKSNIKYSNLTDLVAIEMAFIDGESSEKIISSNKGRGFTKMLKFTLLKKGYLSVRTDRFHFLNSKRKNCSWFPGTQIVIFIPANS